MIVLALFQSDLKKFVMNSSLLFRWEAKQHHRHEPNSTGLFGFVCSKFYRCLSRGLCFFGINLSLRTHSRKKSCSHLDLLPTTSACTQTLGPLHFKVNLLGRKITEVSSHQNTWYHLEREREREKKTPAGIIYRLSENDWASRWPLTRETLRPRFTCNKRSNSFKMKSLPYINKQCHYFTCRLHWRQKVGFIHPPFYSFLHVSLIFLPCRNLNLIPRSQPGEGAGDTSH